jgi:hypothetical protein
MMSIRNSDIYALDAPDRPGREPKRGETRWVLSVPLDEVHRETLGGFAYIHMGRKGRSALLGMLQQEMADDGECESPWSKDVPTEQGEYWHWDGDVDSRPLPLFVLKSGADNKCFVARGQLGIKEVIDCDKFGGYWSKLPEYPPLPAVK